MFVKYFVFKTMTKGYYTQRNNRRSQLLSCERNPWNRMSVSTWHCVPVSEEWLKLRVAVGHKLVDNFSPLNTHY